MKRWVWACALWMALPHSVKTTAKTITLDQSDDGLVMLLRQVEMHAMEA